MRSAIYAFFAVLVSAGALAMTGSQASAATAGGVTLTVQDLLNGSAVEKPMVHKVQAGRCIRWRRVCARRWGVGNPRYRRCVRRHGCGLARPHLRRCATWRRTCARRWGLGTPRFRRCMRRHNCR